MRDLGRAPPRQPAQPQAGPLPGAGIAAARTVAVIGHGRSPEGRGWGERIDQFDVVIRMWDCRWQQPCDHGTRYDYGLFEVHPLMMTAFHANLQRYPSIGWIGSVLGKTDPRLIPARTELIDQKPWNDIGRRMGGVGATGNLQFTRGTIAACWATERAVRGCRVVLVGFDNIADGVTLPIERAFFPAYRSNPGTFTFGGYKGGKAKDGNHDFAIEKPVMDRLGADRGITVAFAHRVW